MKPAVVAVAVAAQLIASSGSGVGGRARAQPADSLDPSDVAAACRTDNPYLVTACHIASQASLDGSLASVVAFRDTPDGADHVVLATDADVGAVWGLAHSSADGVVYAAAYNKRATRFGPGGPGAIYRVDVWQARATHFVTVPNAGPDRHDPTDPAWDRAAAAWVGKTGLGDIDVSEDETELYVVNLADRRIYRFALPSGQLTGSFPHGAAGLDWSEDARPFGLKVWDGEVFHGVVRSAQSSQNADELLAEVYASSPDGSNMRQVAGFSLRYDRGEVQSDLVLGMTDAISLDWLPWAYGFALLGPPDVWWALYPQPMLSDIEFDKSGNLVLGFRDRQTDMTMWWFTGLEQPGFGLGDIVLGRTGGDTWSVIPEPEFYDDSVVSLADEGAQGGLASIVGFESVVAGSVDIGDLPSETLPRGSATWFDERSGNRIRREEVCRSAVQGSVAGAASLRLMHDEYVKVMRSPGDLEVLCPPAAPSPTPTRDRPTATATTPAGSATVTASPSPSASATGTTQPTPAPPVFLPIAIWDEPCRPERAHSDVVLVMDASSSMRETTRGGETKLSVATRAARILLDELRLPEDQAAIVSFNADAVVEQVLTGERSLLERALDGIRVAELTRLERGIALGHLELVSSRHLAGNNRVMVVLTDGRSNPGPAQTAIDRADDAKKDGVRILTIGLGRAVDEALLQRVASRPRDYYFSPEPEDLAAIYAEIAHELPCPPSDFWPYLP